MQAGDRGVSGGAKISRRFYLVQHNHSGNLEHDSVIPIPNYCISHLEKK